MSMSRSRSSPIQYSACSSATLPPLGVFQNSLFRAAQIARNWPLSRIGRNVFMIEPPRSGPSVALTLLIEPSRVVRLSVRTKRDVFRQPVGARLAGRKLRLHHALKRSRHRPLDSCLDVRNVPPYRRAQRQLLPPFLVHLLARLLHHREPLLHDVNQGVDERHGIHVRSLGQLWSP